MNVLTIIYPTTKDQFIRIEDQYLTQFYGFHDISRPLYKNKSTLESIYPLLRVSYTIGTMLLRTKIYLVRGSHIKTYNVLKKNNN